MSTVPTISAEECMGFVRALGDLQRGLALKVKPWMEAALGIDLRLFILLKRIQGGCAHPGELAKGSMETPSQVTRQVDKLQGLGLVERTLDREDSRRIRLALTPRAKSLLDEVDAAFVRLLAPAFDSIDAGDRRSMVAGLQTLSGAIQSGRADPG